MQSLYINEIYKIRNEYYINEITTQINKTPPIINPKLKKELLQKTNVYIIPSLKDLVKRQLTSEELRISREIDII
jgi:hypothetical protein